MLPRRHPEADPAGASGPSGASAKEQGWFASTSRHWNIDRPDPGDSAVTQFT
jgi:hypothetical protein